MPITAEDLDRENAESWRPEPGDKITGVVQEISSNDAGWGEYPILTIELEDGTTRAIHCFHSVLKKEVAQKAPQVGESVGVKYFGKANTASGTEFHKYKFIVERSPDWNKVEEQATQELGEEVPTDDAPF